MNMSLSAVEALEAAAGAVDDALEGGVDEVDLQRGSFEMRRSMPPQHPSAPHEVDALEDEVLGELGRCLRERTHDDVDDLRAPTRRSVLRFPRGQHDHLGKDRS